MTPQDYMDHAPTAIGIPTRMSEVLERHHGTTTIRRLLCLTQQQILETPQINKASLDVILQALANIGMSVPGFSRDPMFSPTEVTLQQAKKTSVDHLPFSAVTTAEARKLNPSHLTPTAKGQIWLKQNQIPQITQFT